MNPLDEANNIINNYINKRKIVEQLKKLIENTKKPISQFKNPKYCVRCGMYKEAEEFHTDFHICTLCFMTMEEEEIEYFTSILSSVPLLTPLTIQLFNLSISKTSYKNRELKKIVAEMKKPRR